MSREKELLNHLIAWISGEPRSQQFDICCYIGKELFLRKNTEYGDSIKETGVLGAVVAIHGICARLSVLCIKGKFSQENVRELLVDLFVDLHNYANIALIMLGEDNLDGV